MQSDLVDGGEIALPDRLVSEAWKKQPLNRTNVPHPDEWHARGLIFSKHVVLL